jgi:chorismate mutase/prephenate dehydrogenase
MTERPAETRPLAALRAMIDAIDRDVLQLLSRRMAIVGEIAAHKREHRIRIRDRARERSVLSDRVERAEKLGLPPGVIESVWRLILLASRDYQASLRAEVPADVAPRTVAVIGGRGGMGKVMAGLFADLGHAVMIADVDTELTPAEAAASADVVVVGVPIGVTEDVIRAIGPHVREDGVIVDVTSIKEAPVRAMLESTKASVVGTHPMFGPGVHTLQGQRVVVCPGRGDEWLAWVKQMLAARGLVVTEATPEEHDRAMAIVQVLNHYHTQVLGLSLARMGVPMSSSLEFTSPVYLLESYVTARHFAQSPDLYGPIEMTNPRTGEVTGAFRHAAAELAEVLQARDQERFRALFEEVRGFFGDFTEEALEQSRYLIDRLIELTAGR